MSQDFSLTFDLTHGSPTFPSTAHPLVDPSLLPIPLSPHNDEVDIPLLETPMYGMSSASPSRFPMPLPYGAIYHDDGTQFVVFSRNATGMRVLLYDSVGQADPSQVIDFDPKQNRIGNVWSIFLPEIKAGQLYHFQADGPYDPHHGMRFDPQARLIDPYAKALAGTFMHSKDGIIRPPRCVVVDDAFNWEGDVRICRPISESIIYEMHVRGFTQSKSSGVEHPGTYLGVIEKIPYLKSLGINTVELMPVHEFPIRDCHGNKKSRPNYWGYDPLAFFAPHRGYATSKEPGAQVKEFKQMVQALHAEGIEVILDVVFNHTAEGNEMGPTLSFKGLENSIYYMLCDDARYYKNYSGCGNTINGNHPVTRELIFNCLRNWVLNYHVDGFRFDLASVLKRDRNGHLMPDTPVAEYIAEDPLLANTKIIAEAWDAAGAFQVGSFGGRWAEWNGIYRDEIRRYWRGDEGRTGQLATRMAGSSDLYQHSGRKPYHSINFITSHDGFPLNDLVSYSDKHNEANGEGNRDGDNNNNSCNYGVEGPTRKKALNELRLRQIKNFFCTLMLSQGVPMIVSGDEVRRTQKGNNNAYCQDNPISWFDWTRAEKNQELFRFVQTLTHFRRYEPTLRQSNFLCETPQRPGGLPGLQWFSPEGYEPCWYPGERGVTCLLGAVPRARTKKPNHNILIMQNAFWEPRNFVVPEIAKGWNWHYFLNTAEKSPSDIFPALDGPALSEDGKLQLESRSCVVLIARDSL